MSNIIKVLKTTLRGTLSTTGLTFTVQKFVDSKNVEVVDADFDGDFVVVISQGSKIEIILCTGITQSGSDDTAVIAIDSSGRHLNPKSPWTGGATGEQFTAGARVVATNDPYTMSRLASIDKANTFSLLQTFDVMPKSSDIPTDSDHLINKTYADALLLGSLTTLNVVVPATAGETVAGGDLVYYDTTDKEWKLCDADTASTVENVMLAISQGAGTNGNAITGGVLLKGMDSKQTGMTAGDIMYASNTAGEIANSAGTNDVAVGVAKSATDLYFNPRFNQQLTDDEIGALVGDLTTPSSANKFVTQAGLQKGAEIFGADAEADDDYIITLDPVPASYYTGMVINFSANTANTGACTLNVNGLGAIAIKKLHDQDLVNGDIEAGQIVTVVYNGANFQMQSQLGQVALDVVSLIAGEALGEDDAVIVADEIAEAEIDVIGTNGGGSEFGNTTWWARPITIPTTIKGGISKVQVNVGGVPDGNVVASVRSTLTGSDIGGLTASASAVGGGLKTLTFSSNVPVVAGGSYFIIYRMSASTQGGGSYKNEVGAVQYHTSADSGASWNESETNRRITTEVNKVFAQKALGGKAYLCNATSDDLFANNFIGFVREEVALEGTTLVEVGRLLSGFTGLTVGKTYYITDTDGTIATSAGSESRPIGIALSATEILIKHDNN